MRLAWLRIILLVPTALPCAAHASTQGGAAQLLLPTAVAGLVVGAFTGAVVPEGRYRYGILFAACAIFIAVAAAIYLVALHEPYSHDAILRAFVVCGMVGGAPFLIAAVLAAAFLATE